MVGPTLIMDSAGDVWKQRLNGNYDCLITDYDDNAYKDRSLDDLHNEFGPLATVVKGDKLAEPVLSNGQQVNCELSSPVVYGKVESYAVAEKYYNVLIRVPRERVRQA